MNDFMKICSLEDGKKSETYESRIEIKAKRNTKIKKNPRQFI